MSTAQPLAPGTELDHKLLAARPLLRAAAASLFGQEPVIAWYPEYLQAMHDLVRATVPLMRDALDVLAHAEPEDAIAAPLAEYLHRHIDEEMGHDELILRDLSALGIPPDEVRTRPPYRRAVTLAGEQYYWIRHVHPVVLLGHVYVFESDPMPVAAVDRLVERSGLSPGAFSTLRVHAELDVDHGTDVRQLLDTLPLTPELRASIGQNALSSVANAASLLDDVARAKRDLKA